MKGRMRWIQRRGLVLAVAAVGVVAIVGTTSAGPAGAVKTFTGCLSAGDGLIIKVKEGTAPKSACSSGQVLARLSGGDITKISVTGALTLPDGPGTGESGDVTIGLKPEFTLPADCATGRVAKWNGSAWTCGVDNDTTYSAGTGLDLSASNAFSIEPDYRVKNTPDCPSGQFATGFDGDGDIQCAAPATPAGVRAYSSTVGETILAGDTVVTSKNLPAGTYLLFASVALLNTDGNANGDGYSVAVCRIPGYSTNNTELVWPDEEFAESSQSVSLASAIVHAGGPVELRCEEKESLTSTSFRPH